MKEDKRKLKDSMQEWLEVFKYPALQRTSYDRLEITAVSQIYPKLGNIPIGKISIEDIQNTINDVMVSGLSYSTARKTYLLLAEYFRYLEQIGIIEFNPVNCVEMMKKAHYMDAQGKTKSSIRDVPLNFAALEMIKELREERYFGNDSPLLCKSDGSFTNPNELGSRFKEFQIVCGIREPKTLHALRHTFATNLINGVEQQDGHIERLTVKQVADILGHTTTEITERYYVKRDNSRLKGLTNHFEL